MTNILDTLAPILTMDKAREWEATSEKWIFVTDMISACNVGYDPHGDKIEKLVSKVEAVYSDFLKLKTFRIYQVQLTDDQRNELNGPNGGWDSKPEFSAYADMSMGSGEGRTADDVVLTAAEFGLFVHAGNIFANDVAQTFEIGNIGPEGLIKRIDGRNMTSISVGNVVVDERSGEAWMCDTFGWAELTDKSRKTIEANTPTRMFMDAA